MDKTFLKYYNDELQYFREKSQMFAEKHPKIAGRLQISQDKCQDPYVERLLEGVAFMSARIHHKLDSEFPRFTQSLINTVYPYNNVPTPAITTVSLQPDFNSDISTKITIPKGTVLSTKEKFKGHTACKFSTTSEVNLYPFKISHACYKHYNPDIQDAEYNSKNIKSHIKINLKNTSSTEFPDFEIQDFPIYISNTGGINPGLIFEYLFTNAEFIIFRDKKKNKTIKIFDNPNQVIETYHFDRNSLLLPYDNRIPAGLALLREYFSYPDKFHYFNIKRLCSFFTKCMSDELEIIILFNKSNSSLNSISNNSFQLYTTPAINMFPRELDRIYISNRKSEYHVTTDRLNPLDFEIINILKVIGYNSDYSKQTEFKPLFRTDTSDNVSFYSINRADRNFSESENLHGTRSGYKGSECYISLTDKNSQPIEEKISELSIYAMCSNRDLPQLMYSTYNNLNLKIYNGNFPVSDIKIITIPSKPLSPLASTHSDWDIINLFSIDFLSLCKAHNKTAIQQIKKVLSIFCGDNELTKTRDISNGLYEIRIDDIVKRVDNFFPITYMKGVNIKIIFDEEEIVSDNIVILSAVLDYLFAANMPLNSFLITTASSLQRGDLATWPMRTGIK